MTLLTSNLPNPMTDPRLSCLAHVLVHYSLGVKPGQTVRLSGPELAVPLIVELYRAVLRADAHPVLRLTLDACNELFLREASEAQISYLYPLAVREIETLDATVNVWAESNTRSMTGVDPRRLALASAARRPIMEIFMRRAASGELKWVGTQFPTQACAQDADMSLSEYEEFVFAAGLLHEADPVAAWKRLSERQQRLVDFLNGKSDYRVTAPNGTDLRMSLAGQRWINCDGHENFPDGEVFSGPVPESVNGTVCFSFPAVHMGREVTDVRLVFRDGVVVDASASKGQDFLLAMLEMDAGARRLGECAIGTNYSIRRHTRNTLFDEKIGGTVHFALGAGYPETGNTNTSGLHWDMVLDLRSGGRIELDGQLIAENGRFTRPEWPQPES
ncbi:MAG: aminopeptidase [Tepidisphaerales bacterium]